MNARWLIVSLTLGSLACGSAPAGLSEADVAAVRNASQSYVKAVLAKDWNTWMGLHAENAVVMPAGEGRLEGGAAIRKWAESLPPLKSLSLSPAEVTGRGDTAIVRGTYAVVAADIPATGHYMEVWQKQPDGNWRLSRDLWNSGDTSTPGPAAMSPDQELSKVERDWNEATLKKDGPALQRIYADEYFSTDPDGGTWNKTQDIANVTSGMLKFESAELSELQARVYGDIAIVTGLNTVKGTMAGRSISGPARFTDIYVRRDGRWQCIVSQGTRVAKPIKK